MSLILPKDFHESAIHPDRYSKEGSDACGLSGFWQERPTQEGVDRLLTAISCNAHRGGETDRGADGVGILFNTTNQFRAALLGQALEQTPDTDQERPSMESIANNPGLGAGSVFFKDKSREEVTKQQQVIQELCQMHGVEIHAWREVPVDDNVLNQQQTEDRPAIFQPLFTVPDNMSADEAEMLCGNLLAIINRTYGDKGVSMSSFSMETIIYKGMIRAKDFSQFYQHDLVKMQPETHAGMIHVRFSTNTSPDWSRAQPFSYVAHNGEINTLTTCRNAAAQLEKFRENNPSLARSAIEAAQQIEVLPYVLSHMGSDSQDFNQCLHAFLQAGYQLVEAMRIMVPQAAPAVEAEIKAYLDYMQHTTAGLGSWHGPAALIAQHRGEMVAMVDRMALRPLKWVLLKDNTLLVGSEIGALHFDWQEVKASGQLNPGEMIHMSRDGEFSETQQIMEALTNNLKAKGIDPQQVSQVYLSQSSVRAEGNAKLNEQTEVPPNPEDVFSELISIGWNKEDVEALKLIIRDGNIPLVAMGYARPLYALTDKPEMRRLFEVFHQHFAQVTNPPIDSLREGAKMSLVTFVGGKRGDIKDAHDPSAYADRHCVELASSVVDEATLEGIRHNENLQVLSIDASIHAGETVTSACARIAAEAEKATEGSVILLEDKTGFADGNIPLPSARAAWAVIQTLKGKGLAQCVDVGVSASDVAEPHDAMVLMSMGVGFVYPRGVHRLVDALATENDENSVLVPKKSTKKEIPLYGSNNEETTVVNFPQHGQEESVNIDDARKQIQKVFDGGMKKIMAKFGIPTIEGYRHDAAMVIIGCKIFEDGFVTPVGGFDDRALDGLLRRQSAHKGETDFPSLKIDEYDFNTPIQGIHNVLDSDHDLPTIFNLYMQIANRVNQRQAIGKGGAEGVHMSMFSDLLQIKGLNREDNKVELDPEVIKEVLQESVVAGAMSHGALGELAHEAIAKACNELGVQSNSGEGGESKKRTPGSETRIRQVASGRFGVTDDYLAALGVESIQIKMAQGAKPGEGGQLVGDKVNERIAKNRHCEPGTTLISPPPHHDIYSIEDLSQLIFDLRQINPTAKLEVKLAATAGVDVVACGVAKAGADVIVIDGFHGGTGATPQDSKNHTGIPWEIGLPMVHKALCKEGLRDGIELHIGGGMRTGQDAVKAEILGADKVILGTNLMIYQGCTKEDECHGTNKFCTAAVAHEGALAGLKERDPTEYTRLLEQRVRMIKNGLMCLAAEKQVIYQQLGVANGKELRGRTDLFKRLTDSNGRIVASHLDFDNLLETAPTNEQTFFPAQEQREEVKESLGHRLAQELKDTLKQDKIDYDSEIIELKSTDRTVGGAIAGEVVRAGKSGKLSDDSIRYRFTGSAGQKFGFALTKGVTFHHTGSTEDYVGEALSGGRIIVKQPHWDNADPKAQYTIGGKCGFGATSGELFTDGRAADRFGVRLSGATLACDGCGEFGAEYMTGGTLISLSPVGEHFAHAMTGGVAFVYDDNNLANKLGKAETDGEIRNMTENDENRLKIILAKYAGSDSGTDSKKAQVILADWDQEKGRFSMVVPKSMTQKQVHSPQPKASVAPSEKAA